MKKLILIVSLFTISCTKTDLVQPTSEWKGDLFVRVQSVGKDSVNTYSPITHIKIK